MASSSSTSSTSSISVLPDYITSSHSRPGSPSRHSRHGTPTSAAEKGKSPVARGEGIVRLKLSSALESYPPHLMAAVTGLQNVSKPSVQLVLPERVVGIVPPTVTFGQGQSDDAGALEGGRGVRSPCLSPSRCTAHDSMIRPASAASSSGHRRPPNTSRPSESLSSVGFGSFSLVFTARILAPGRRRSSMSERCP